MEDIKSQSHHEQNLHLTNNPANLASQVFGFQRFLLQLFGFAPCNLWRVTFIRVVMWLVAAGVLAASMAEFLYQTVMMICEIQSTQTQRDSNLVLTILLYAPYLAESVRGLFVLVILVGQRKSWQHLAHFADEIVNETFLDDKERSGKLRKWRRFAIVFGVSMIFMHLGWEVASIIGDTGNTFWPDTYPVTHNRSAQVCQDFAIKLPWQFIVASVAEGVPFCLSQQIFAIMIVLAFVLKSGAKVLNERVTQLREEVTAKVEQNHVVIPENVTVVERCWEKPTWQLEEYVAVVKVKVAAIQEFHLRLILFSHEVNHVFGWILFLMYGMDLLVLAGYVALLVTTEVVITLLLLHLVSIIMFGCFATLFYIPMVQAHEEAEEITFNLRRLIGVTAKLDSKENTLQKRLEVFCAASRRHVIIFEGAELLHVTRMFIVTTCTMTISIGVLTYEVLAKGAL